jgi:hypothetical protein
VVITIITNSNLGWFPYFEKIGKSEELLLNLVFGRFEGWRRIWLNYCYEAGNCAEVAPQTLVFDATANHLDFCCQKPLPKPM